MIFRMLSTPGTDHIPVQKIYDFNRADDQVMREIVKRAFDPNEVHEITKEVRLSSKPGTKIYNLG